VIPKSSETLSTRVRKHDMLTISEGDPSNEPALLARAVVNGNIAAVY
jgi:hypothetical protein